MTSSRIFRSDLENGKKYALTGLVSVAAFISYFIIVAAITIAMGKK